MSSGIKVSSSGDVLKADITDLAVSSDIPNLMVLDGQDPPHAGTTSDNILTNLAPGTTYTLLTIAHGLGYIPATMLNWANLNRTSYGTGILSLSPLGDCFYIGDADATNFYLRFVKTLASTQDTTNQAWNFRYYIFTTPLT